MALENVLDDAREDAHGALRTAESVGAWITGAQALRSRIDDLVLEKIIETGQQERMRLREDRANNRQLVGCS